MFVLATESIILNAVATSAITICFVSPKLILKIKKEIQQTYRLKQIIESIIIAKKHLPIVFDKQVFFIILYFVALSYMQYRLRHPSFTAPRGPPSPKVREKAD